MVRRIEVRESDAMICPLESNWCIQDQLPFACSGQLGVCLLSWNCCEVEEKERESGEEAEERRLVWGRTYSVFPLLVSLNISSSASGGLIWMSWVPASVKLKLSQPNG